MVEAYFRRHLLTKHQFQVTCWCLNVPHVSSKLSLMHSLVGPVADSLVGSLAGPVAGPVAGVVGAKSGWETVPWKVVLEG